MSVCLKTIFVDTIVVFAFLRLFTSSHLWRNPVPARFLCCVAIARCLSYNPVLDCSVCASLCAAPLQLSAPVLPSSRPCVACSLHVGHAGSGLFNRTTFCSPPNIITSARLSILQRVNHSVCCYCFNQSFGFDAIKCLLIFYLLQNHYFIIIFGCLSISCSFFVFALTLLLLLRASRDVLTLHAQSSSDLVATAQLHFTSSPKCRD